MKKWLLIITPIVLLAILAVWFWSLASVPDEEASSVTLTVVETGVDVRRPDETAWEAAVDGMKIGEGWSVRTDKTGMAVITFYGQGQSRLGNETEVTVTRSMLDASNPSNVDVELELGAGRVWSRVLKLLDLDSSYAVRTSSVVATVRGTAFDVRANADGSSDVLVSDSAVGVTSFSASPSAVAEGFAVSFASNGSMGEVRAVTAEERSAAWFRQNTAADDAFIISERERRLKVLRSMDGPRPDSVVSGLASLSERLHLAFKDDNEREALAGRYLARRYLHLIDLVEQGKTGLAAQEFARLENYIRTELKGPDAEVERQRILSALRRVTFLVEDADPDSPLFAFKQRMENLAEALTQSNEGSMLYVRLLALDARIDEVRRMIARKAYEDAQTALDGVRNGIENASREAEPVLPRLSEERQRTIQGKISALRARETAMRARLEAARAPAEEEESATSTEDGTSEPPEQDVTPPSEEPPVTEPPVTTEPEFDRITLSIQPNPLSVGETANLMVTAYRADGSQVNVSSRSTFEVAQNIGTLNGPRFTATQAGSTTVTAHYDDNGVTRSAGASVTTKSSAVLESLILASTAGTVLKPGQGTNITAQARYSDGYVKDVTTLTEYSLSGVGTLNITAYTTNRNTTGEATITGYFTEGGVSVQGSVVLTVQ